MLTVREKVPVYGTDENGKRRYRFFFVGLKKDTKPVAEYNGSAIANGSRFLVMDDDKSYLFDEEAKSWHEYSGGGDGGGGEVPEEDIATDDDIDEVIGNLDDL